MHLADSITGSRGTDIGVSDDQTDTRGLGKAAPTKATNVSEAELQRAHEVVAQEKVPLPFSSSTAAAVA